MSSTILISLVGVKQNSNVNIWGRSEGGLREVWVRSEWGLRKVLDSEVWGRSYWGLVVTSSSDFNMMPLICYRLMLYWGSWCDLTETITWGLRDVTVRSNCSLGCPWLRNWIVVGNYTAQKTQAQGNWMTWNDNYRLRICWVVWMGWDRMGGLDVCLCLLL